jgi:hypothetical protein
MKNIHLFAVVQQKTISEEKISYLIIGGATLDQCFLVAKRSDE